MGDSSLAVVLLRLVVAIAVVIGLLLLTARLTRRVGLKGQSTDRNALRVVSRQPLSRAASVAVVEVRGRTLVLGVTDHAVTLLTEQESDPIADAASATAITMHEPSRTTAHDGPSPKNSPRMSLVETLRERTVRRT